MFIFEWGDHGNLLVMAKHRNQGVPTDEVFYSYDSGLCWHSVKLGRAMYLENIRVEPQGGSNKFIIHGEQVHRPRVTSHSATRANRPSDPCTSQTSDWPNPPSALYPTFPRPQSGLILLALLRV
jgi:hypothetical protein